MPEVEPLALRLSLNAAVAGSAPLDLIGGKGASLARLAAAGLPVPPGFVLTTKAYRRFVTVNGIALAILEAVGRASPDDPASLAAAAETISALFDSGALPDEIADAIRDGYAALGAGDPPVAVRSSATAEDLPTESFAGQQETYLNVRGEADLLRAVRRCWASLWTARAIAYRASRGVAHADVALAVVIQAMVPADAAGVLFTADPLTGDASRLVINATWGLGESLVGGDVTPDTYVVDRATGRIVDERVGEKTVMTVRDETGTREVAVPAELRARAALAPARASELARLGVRIEELYGRPMDVEWALAGDRFAILQARPITTLGGSAEVASAEWNETLRGDYLWSSTNLGEAVPDVMTPCTWSLFKLFIAHAMPANHMFGFRPVGNVGGRPYMNLSITASQAASFGVGPKRLAGMLKEVFGNIPETLEIPLIPISRLRVLRELVPTAVRLQLRVRANVKRLSGFLATAPARCEALRDRIATASDPADLVALWRGDLEPYFHEACAMLEAAGRQGGGALVRFRGALGKLVGEKDAADLLTGLHSESSQLASLGPVLGLARLARGEIDRETFAREYGHRSPSEFEVSSPRPAEDADWIDRQIAGLREAAVDADALLARQRATREAAWSRLRERYPRKEADVRRKIERWAAVAHDRERARSEVVRAFSALRAFVLRAGEMAGLGDDVFFLSIDEILALLGGDRRSLAAIPARRAMHARLSALPPYPALIRGRFDPFRWAADPNRRSDVYDETREGPPVSQTVVGFPGASGIVEGRARVIATAREGDALRPGEVLVTTVTNVGWTPLFPRAAAVVTDVGAPLSHAAIVARELGIPAVVGTGNATMRLRTGDLVRVDGGRGTVEVLRPAGSD